VLLNASLGKPVGFLQPQIYVASAASGSHDITQGNKWSATEPDPVGTTALATAHRTA